MSKISHKTDTFLLNYSYLFWGPLIWDTVYMAQRSCHKTWLRTRCPIWPRLWCTSQLSPLCHHGRPRQLHQFIYTI